MPSNLYAILMGIGAVLAGLILIVLLRLTQQVGEVVRRMQTAAPAAPAAAPAPAPVPAEPIPNRQAMVAAIAAAIAEDLGTDVGGIRILSIKRL